MSNNFPIAVKKSNGSLQLSPSGDFDGSSAWELVNLIQEEYDGNGQVLIDTHNIQDMCPFGCSTFQYRLNLSRVPAERLLFKGEKGHEIAPRGSKVIVDTKEHPCRCDGKCTNCPCSEKKKK